MGSDDSESDNRDRVLAPDDLDITDQPEVAEIDDGRYVVSSSGPVKKPDRELLENPDWLDKNDDDATGASERDSQPRQEQSNSQPESTTQSSPTDESTAHQARTPQPAADEQPQQSRSTSQKQSRGGRGQQPPAADQPAQRTQSTPEESREPKPSSPDQQPSASRSHQPSTPDQPTEQSRQSAPAERSTPTGQANTESPHPASNELAAHDQPPVEPPAVELTNENVSKFLAESLAQSSGEYGFDATVNIEGQVNRGRMTSDDIGETLETLLRWYARQTTDEVEPESVLGIILAGSDLAVEYPVQSVYAVVKRHGLQPDDSIGDLLSAVRKDGSFTVPPSKD